MANRFKKGQTVYMNRGDKMKTLVVARVIKNPHLPIYQYSFEAPHDGFACGEQSIRKTPDGRDLTLRECFVKDKEVQFRINAIASAKRTVVEESNVNFPKISVFDCVRVDFKPDLTLAKWLVEYSKGRLMIHVGSGQGHLVNMLKMRGGKSVGIEPNINKELWIKHRMERDGALIDVNEILEGEVKDYKKLMTDLGKEKGMLIIDRPKNKDFLRETVSLMPVGMELIYITLDEFPFVVNEPYFRGFDLDTQLLSPLGQSEDNDLIYSICRKS